MNKKTVNFFCMISMLMLPFAWWKWRSWNAERLWKQRVLELHSTRQNAQPIIRAIHAYYKDKGHAPGSLSALVPRYIKSLPPPGKAARGVTWYYSVSDKWKKLAPIPRSDHFAWKSDWAFGIEVRTDFCPFHWMSFGDYFMYHPKQDYEPSYGGGPEPLWDWAFYHE
jgi:hypothetical protein